MCDRRENVRAARIIHHTQMVAVIRLTGGQNLGHKADVRDGQPQRFDARQPFLVGERGHLAAQLVERLVQIEHAPALANVGRPPLSDGGDATARLLCSAAAAAARGAAVMTDGRIVMTAVTGVGGGDLRAWPHG